MNFASPSYLWLLILIPMYLLYHYFINRPKHATLNINSLGGLKAYASSPKIVLIHFMPYLFSGVMALIIIALARPQSSSSSESISTEGIDIVLAMDVSPSMLAMDLQPNRLEAAKKTAAEFVQNRPSDRIGLVIFSGESFTLVPATTDHNVLLNQMSNVQPGALADGTAIGMGLATAVDRLRSAQGKSKIIILLTDGVNNTGTVDPLTSTEIAKKYGIRVYTIGAGTYGQAYYPTPQGNILMDVDIDDVLMKRISKETGGKYFRATDTKSLKNVYKEIDKLEKTRIEINSFHQKTEEFYPYALMAFGLLFLLTLLKSNYLRVVPN